MWTRPLACLFLFSIMMWIRILLRSGILHLPFLEVQEINHCCFSMIYWRNWWHKYSPLTGFESWTAAVQVYEADDIPMCHSAYVYHFTSMHACVNMEKRSITNKQTNKNLKQKQHFLFRIMCLLSCSLLKYSAYYLLSFTVILTILFPHIFLTKKNVFN